MITIIISIFAVLVMGVCTLIGMKRGLFRVGMRTASFILAFIAALILSIFLSDVVGEALHGLIPTDFGDLSELMEASPSLGLLLLFIISKATAPILFVLSFLIFNLLFLIPHCIVSSKLKLKDREVEMFGMAKKRLFGAGSGLVGGFLLFMVLCVPMLGYSDIAYSVSSDAITVMEDIAENEDSADMKDTIDMLYAVKSATGEISNNPLLVASRALGGGVTFDALTSGSLDSANVSLRAEVSALGKLVVGTMPLTSTDIAEWNETQIAALENVIDTIPQSYVVSSVASDIISYAGSKWENGESFMGIEPIGNASDSQPYVFAAEKENASGLSEEVLILVGDFYNLMATTTPSTISGDLHTLANVLSVAIDHDVLKEFSAEDADMMKILTKENLLADTICAVYENERFKPMIPDTLNVGMGAIADALELTPEERSQLLLNRELALSTLNSSNISDEAKTIEKLLFDIIDIANTDTTDMSNLSAVSMTMKKVGAVSDDMSASLLYGEKVEAFLKCLTTSSIVGDSLGVSKDELHSLVDVLVSGNKENGDSYSSSMNSVSSIVDYLDVATNPNATREEKINSVKQTITSMTDTGSSAVDIVVKSDFVKNLVVEDKDLDRVTSIVSSVVEEFPNITDEADLEKEGAAVNMIVELTVSISNMKKEDNSNQNPDGETEAQKQVELFGESGVVGADAYEMVDTLASSNIISNAAKNLTESGEMEKIDMSDSVSEKEIDEINTALDTYYNENVVSSNASAEEKAALVEILNNLGSIFGMDKNFVA